MPHARRSAQPSRKASAHRLIATTAMEMAMASFEELARDNLWYELYAGQHPNVPKAALGRFFSRTQWHLLVPQARAILAGMLADPRIPEAQKAEISEALILDNSLPQGQNAASLPGPTSVH